VPFVFSGKLVRLTIKGDRPKPSDPLVGMDLRTEPMVLSVPAVEKGRYYSVQLPM
jgi:hypothetical protein